MQSRDRLLDLPKAELHAHLNGCVPSEIVHRLVDEHSIAVPTDFVLPNDLMIQQPVPSLIDYFRLGKSSSGFRLAEVPEQNGGFSCKTAGKGWSTVRRASKLSIQDC